MTDLPSQRRVQAAAHRAITAGAVVRPRAIGSIGRLFGALNIWFWAIVGVPTLIAAVYYFGIASDLYLSEAKFVVRGPGSDKSMMAGGVTSLLQGGFGQGDEEAQMVQEFIMSRDAVRQLDRRDDLRAVFARPGADFVSRFPGLISWRRDFEALYKTYSRFVSVDMDGDTGVSMLEVKAYRPEDAQMIATSLLASAEQLVNELNQRQRQDALRSFQDEVSETEQHIGEIQAQLTAYRVHQQMLDPKSASEGPLKLMATLNTQRADARGQLANMMKNSPSSPQIPVIKTRIASLDRLIADERAKITGDSGSVAAAETEYERLDGARKLAEMQLTSAFKSLEAAKLDAQRQQLYLETIAQPNLPDFPLYPKRIISFSMVLASCLLTYGIAWLLVASVREHAAA
jgi:capsular polysaccharide transport system permease protein